MVVSLKVCDSVLNFVLLIAQGEAVKPVVELTTGQKLANAVGVIVFAASFVVVIRSVLRWQNGDVVMPVAKRKPLHVPTPVAVIGVIVAALLASGAVIASLEDTLLAEADQQMVDIQAPAGEGQVDDLDAALTDDPVIKEQAIEEERIIEQQGEQIIAENQLAEEIGDEAAKQNLNPNEIAWDMINGILGMNGVLLFLFGSLVWLTQADGPGRSVLVDRRVPDRSKEAEASATENQSLDQSFSDFVDDSGDLGVTVLTADQRGPVAESMGQQSVVVCERWDFIAELKFAGLAFLMALVPTIATRLVVVSLMPEPKSHPFIEMMEGGGLAIQVLVFLMLLATISAPIVEELLYRVVVLGGLLNRRSKWVSIGVSAVLFSFAHGFPDCISLLPLAVILGYTYVQRRSYRTVMLVHFIFNAFNMCLVLLQLVG